LGFIKPNGGDDSFFIHKEILSNQKCKPQVNDIKPFSILKYQQVTKKSIITIDFNINVSIILL